MNSIALRAVSDSSDGFVLVDFGDIDVTIPTTFNIRAGDTVQVQITNHKPCVIGVIGRGDETQEQLDTTTENVDKLDNNIEASDTYCVIASNNGVVQAAKKAKDITKLDVNGGRQIIISDAGVIVTPPRDIYQDEIATLQWVKDLVKDSITQALKEHKLI